MNSLFVILFCVFVFVSPTVSQVDTLEALAHLPLQLGNKWQYRNISGVDGDNDTAYVTYEVTGDTLMANGKEYTKLESPELSEDYYLRIDSTELKVYRYDPYVYYCTDSEIDYFYLTAENNETYDTCEQYEVGVNRGNREVGLLTIEADFILYMWYNIITREYILSEEIGISSWFFWELAYSEGELIAAEVNGVEYGTFVNIEDTDPNYLSNFQLYQNYPNPFNSSPVFEYYLPRQAFVEFSVYDISGRMIRQLMNEEQYPGTYRIKWNGTDQNGKALASGVYLYRIRADSYSQAAKLALIR